MKERAVFAAGILLLTGLLPLRGSAADILRGDVDLDGRCSAEDAFCLRDFLLCRQTLGAEQGAGADLSGDGRLNAADLTLLKRHLLAQSSGRHLLWSDEFDGDAPDPTKWRYELGNWKLDADGNYVTNGWGNNEQEYYTDSNASVQNGILTIAARKEHCSDAVQGEYEYTSARLSTQNLFSVCGGRIEVRARCDAGKSLWPAIWMLPEDSVYGGWAASGEIDIMEGWGSTPEKICGTIHFGDVWPGNTYLTGEYSFPAGESTAGWHIYAVEWEPEEIRWYVDDRLYSTQRDWYSAGHAYPAPFNQKFYLILNLAVGGHFDGVDGIYADPSVFADGEKHFDIDYVRVYDGGFSAAQISSLPLELYTEGAQASLANKDGETVITVDDTGALEYAVMGLMRGKPVRPGEVYTLSFDAESTAAREMVVTAEDGTYTRYLDERVAIGPERQHFSFSFSFPSEMKIDLKFQLGRIGDAVLPAHTVTLRNIQTGSARLQ